MSRSSKRRRRRQNGHRTRTQLIRDAALSTGRTCIACGADAVGNVGPYPVCQRHQDAVRAPHRLQRWKDHVRGRHARVPLRACQQCGRTGNLSRHHDWSKGEPGRPPRPIVLCRRCHLDAERESAGPEEGDARF